VGAIDISKKHAVFSNYNAKVELAAPGVQVLSTASRASTERQESGAKVAIQVRDCAAVHAVFACRHCAALACPKAGWKSGSSRSAPVV
jgi:subtilisin family serine protease